jgi:hypothetical protein
LAAVRPLFALATGFFSAAGAVYMDEMAILNIEMPFLHIEMPFSEDATAVSHADMPLSESASAFSIHVLTFLDLCIEYSVGKRSFSGAKRSFSGAKRCLQAENRSFFNAKSPFMRKSGRIEAMNLEHPALNIELQSGNRLTPCPNCGNGATRGFDGTRGTDGTRFCRMRQMI